MRKSRIGSPVLSLANFKQWSFIKLNHGEVLKERDVVRLAFLALKLLAGQCGAMLAREPVDRVADNNTKMFHSHLVNAPM